MPWTFFHSPHIALYVFLDLIRFLFIVLHRLPIYVFIFAPCYVFLPIHSHTTRFCELRPRIFRSPSDVDTLGRASVLRDGPAFRPASAPQPLLLENHFYQSFIHPSETPLHPHTAPHTPTDLEQQLERARSEERSNCDLKESVAEGEIDLRRRNRCKIGRKIPPIGPADRNLDFVFADLRIKQEPMELTDRERTEKLAERLSKRDDEIHPGRRFDAGSYRPNSDHLPHGAQLGPTPAADPPTPDQSPAAPAMWNMKIHKARTVSTVGGGECHLLFLHHETLPVLTRDAWLRL